jgi:hypothetical protein
MEYKDPFHGFLTEDDRAYLEGAKELDPEAERGTRSRIRKRILNGLLDYKLVFEELEEADWRLLFEDTEQTDLHRESPEMRERAEWVLAFLFAGIQEYADEDFEEVLTDAVRRAELTRERKVLSASLDIRYSETAREEAMRKLDTGEALTEEERETLLADLERFDRVRNSREALGDFDIGF